MKKHTYIIAFFLIFTYHASAQEAKTFSDPRDGNIYNTVEIGSQIWMAENLNYETDHGSWCFDDDKRYCELYGRLYNWEAAMNACPPGWKLPSDEDWLKLIRYVDADTDNEPLTDYEWRELFDSVDNENLLQCPYFLQIEKRTIISNIAGGLLKSKGNLKDGDGYWHYPNQGANDAVGFSALPGGNRTGGFGFEGMMGDWWSSTEGQAAAGEVIYSGTGGPPAGTEIPGIWQISISFDKITVERYYSDNNFAFSVRCLMIEE